MKHEHTHTHTHTHIHTHTQKVLPFYTYTAYFVLRCSDCRCTRTCNIIYTIGINFYNIPGYWCCGNSPSPSALMLTLPVAAGCHGSFPALHTHKNNTYDTAMSCLYWCLFSPRGGTQIFSEQPLVINYIPMNSSLVIIASNQHGWIKRLRLIKG